MGEDGHTAGIFPGPDLERAVAGPRERRAVGVRPDPMPEDAPVERVTLTAPALTSARAIMIVIAGAEKRRVLEQAIKEGPLSARPDRPAPRRRRFADRHLLERGGVKIPPPHLRGRGTMRSMVEGSC